MDKKSGLSAIRTFHDQVRRDTVWLDTLSAIDNEMVRSNPGAVLSLLTEGFGLYELDAMDALIRLSQVAVESVPPALLN